MKQYIFTPVEQLCVSEDLGEYHSFGIRASSVENGEETFEGQIADVSVDEGEVSTLAALFTQHQLSPCHLWDAVTDYLGQYED